MMSLSADAAIVAAVYFKGAGMTAFARSDVITITIPQESGGCGEPHGREILNPRDVKKGADPEYADGKLSVECALCEPILVAQHGWSRHEHLVELTPDEVAYKERLEKEGTIAQQVMAKAMGERLAAEMVANAGAAE